MLGNLNRSNLHHSHRFLWTLIVVILVLVIFMYTRPLPALYPINDIRPANTPSKAVLTWPASGEAAIGALGYGVLADSGPQTVKPTASTAKLITALAVLKRHPLSLDQPGPTLTLSSADVAIYDQYVADNGSVLRVMAGEEISEYQMLQAMLLPSANNAADSLAIWAFGSLKAYDAAATQLLNSLGLTSTKLGTDASGFLPSTQSTAHDLVLLAQAAMQNPVLAQIVSQTQASLPVAGVVKNVNWLLGEDGIIGVKTGNTDQAGGVYIFASRDVLDTTHSVTIVGAVQATATLQGAMDAAIPLLNSAKQNFKVTMVAKAGQVIAHYNVPWTKTVSAVTTKNVSTVAWATAYPQPILSLSAVYAPKPANAQVGTLSTTSGTTTVAVVLQHSIPAPPWWWRITRHRL